MSLQRVAELIHRNADVHQSLSPESQEGYRAGLLFAFDMPLEPGGYAIRTCKFDAWMYGHQMGREVGQTDIAIQTLRSSTSTTN